MIKVKNKEHSINLIKQMGLNSMPQSVLDKTDPEGIENFFKKNPAKEYVVRDIFSPMGKYKFVSGLEECLEYVSTIKADRFCVSVSFRTIPGRILLGDIYVKDNMVSLSASKDSSANHRNIYDNPQIMLNCELFDDRLWDVPGFEKLIDYINRFNLYDIVVEFAIFNSKVGTKRENVVIIELRSDY